MVIKNEKERDYSKTVSSKYDKEEVCEVNQNKYRKDEKEGKSGEVGYFGESVKVVGSKKEYYGGDKRD